MICESFKSHDPDQCCTAMGLFIKILTGDNLSSPRYNVTLEITLAPALSPCHKLRAKIIPMVHLGLIPNAFYQSWIYIFVFLYILNLPVLGMTVRYYPIPKILSY